MDLPVEVTFEDVTPDVTLPQFKPFAATPVERDVRDEAAS